MGVVRTALDNETVDILMIPAGNSPTAKMDSSYFEVVELLTTHNIGAVFLTDAEGRLVGVVTDGDIRRAFKAHGPIPLFTISAKGFSTKSPVTCAPHSSLHEALSIMEHEGKKITCLPIVDEDRRFKGVVTMHAIVTWLLHNC